MGLNFFAITETWLGSDEATKREIKTLAEVERISILTRNRNGRGGGVALAFDMTRAQFSIIKLPRNTFEVMCTRGKIEGIEREFIVFVIYLPPKMTAANLACFNEFLADSIEYVLQKYNEPYVVLTGDMNRKDVSPAVVDFPDIKLKPTAATRGQKCLDLTFTNFCDRILGAHVAPPLESNDGSSSSDHRVVFFETCLYKKPPISKSTFTFRPYTTRGEEMFGNLLLSTDWTFLEASEDPAEDLCTRLEVFTSLAFPEKTRTKTNRDKPWVTEIVRKISRRKRREYKRHRRSSRWKKLDDEMNSLVLEGKTSFFERIKTKVQRSSNTREYFKAVSALVNDNQKENERWKINELYPDMVDSEIAEVVATYFNRISMEYSPLERNQTEPDCSTICPSVHQISTRLRTFKKPRSQVRGDIPPKLVTKYHEVLALPLVTIFRRSFEQASWPSLWKTETVTIIPKCSRPTDLSQLRNLSCTPLFSKVMESFILEKLKEEVTLDLSQFGGIKGSSVDHFLIETWDKILRSLEDGRAAATLASIDFQKAFNRMSHQECLKAAEKMGASVPVRGMVKAFLTGRNMRVKINQVK